MSIAVRRTPRSGNSSKNAMAEDFALSLMGVGEVSFDLLAPDVVWERNGGAPAVGRQAVEALRASLPVPSKIDIEEVVTHGKSGAVSGRYVVDGTSERPFCHILRFATAAATSVVHVVSFEHMGGKNGC